MPLRSNGYCFYSFNDAELSVGEEGTDCTLSKPAGANRSVLIFGDSYAAHWDPYFALVAKDYGIRVDSVTTNWCFPNFNLGSTAPTGHISRDQCVFNRDWLVENLANYDYIVLAGAWARVFQLGLGDEVFESIRRMRAESPDTRLVIMQTPPAFERGSVENAVYNQQVSLTRDIEEDVLADAFWARLVREFSGDAGVLMLDRQRIGFVDDGVFKTAEGYPYSLDGRHLSILGAESLYRQMREDEQNSALMNFLLAP
jgi:hypothetical protein